jgi:hypothetical protein
MKTYSPKTQEELHVLARGILNNEVFSSEDIKDPADIPEVFAILKISHAQAIAYIQTFNIKYIWTWRCDATGARHKEYDVYPGCGLLNAADYARLVKTMYELKTGDEQHESDAEGSDA